MKTMTVRDVRQKWPEAERMLGKEGEIVITRDGKPVARLLPVEEVAEVAEQPRKTFDPEEMRRWREATWGDQTFDTLTPLMESREDRVIISESALAAWVAKHEKDDSAQELENDPKL